MTQIDQKKYWSQKDCENVRTPSEVMARSH